jgi:hypothetical protein
MPTAYPEQTPTAYTEQMPAAFTEHMPTAYAEQMPTAYLSKHTLNKRLTHIRLAADITNLGGVMVH